MNLNNDRKPRQPWMSISQSIVPTADVRHDFPDAMASPCDSCSTSPCCSYLPLTTFRTASLNDLDYALYLLNFDRIELGLSSQGDWSVFYRYPCRFLDRTTFGCTLHGQPEQPHICQRYNPYRCWYKTALTRSSGPEYVRLDRTRLQYLITGITFDDQGNIIESPDWKNLLESIENIHDAPVTAEAEVPSHPEPSRISNPLPVYTFNQLQQPCNGCSAYCCKVLMFPVARPADITALDYLKFCLGFPGIRVGISADQWAILVDTKCRHLQHERCSIFGKPERPLACRYYDEWKCAYKLHFEQPEVPAVVHVDLDQYRHVLDRVQLDRNGTVVGMPDVTELRTGLSQAVASASASFHAAAD